MFLLKNHLNLKQAMKRRVFKRCLVLSSMKGSKMCLRQVGTTYLLTITAKIEQRNPSNIFIMQLNSLKLQNHLVVLLCEVTK